MSASDDNQGERAGDEMRGSTRNATLYFLSSIIAKVIGFFYFLSLAHWLNVAEFGLISFAATLAVLSDTAADLGMGRYILREVARDAGVAGRLAGVFLPLKCLISLMIYGIALLFLPQQFRNEQAFSVLAVYALWLSASGVAILLEQILHARNRFGFASLARFVPGIVQILAGAVVGFAGGGAVAFAGAAAISSLSYICVIGLGLRRINVRIDFTGAVARCAPALCSALPFAAVTTLLLVSLKVEFLVFVQVADTEAVGIYSMAARLYEAALTAPFAYSAVMTARLVQAANKGRDAFGALYMRTIRTAANGGVAAALFGAVVTLPFVTMVLPGDYAASAPLLLTMLFGFPFMTLHLVNVSAMLSLSAQGRPASLMLGLILLQFVIAKVLLTFWGMTGVAIATGVFAVVACVVSTIAIRLWLSEKSVLRALAPAAVAGGAAITVHLMLDTQSAIAHIIAFLAALLAMALAHKMFFLPERRQKS